MDKTTDWIWSFHGDGAMLCTAVFTDFEQADKWIREYKLSGVLTKMPVNQSIYHWATETGMFRPKSDLQQTPQFIQRFTSAYLEHYHYENGNNDE